MKTKTINIIAALTGSCLLIVLCALAWLIAFISGDKVIFAVAVLITFSTVIYIDTLFRP